MPLRSSVINISESVARSQNTHTFSFSRASTSCESPEPAETLADRLNKLLSTSGQGYTLSLCPGKRYTITAPLRFTAPNQEISTAGYPTGPSRAMLVVSGSIVNGRGQTTAVDGKCTNCDGVKLRNVQINGTRVSGPPIHGGANIEMGGPNSNQLVEHVHSFFPRGWSCLHVGESHGNPGCTSATIRNNDIGPAGTSFPRHWADGISVACRNSVIKNNMVDNPTDGGIVLFGSPGTLVENNTIWVKTQTLLGAINMVDVTPYGGNYDGVVVTNNTIIGAFASQTSQGSKTKGPNSHDAIIKIGIAIGPRTWFGDRYGKNVSFGGTVRGNHLTGAFGYGIALTSAKDFTVENNILVGNTSFIGVRKKSCTAKDRLPSPAAFVVERTHVQNSTMQSEFASVVFDGSLQDCLTPPTGGNLWPFANTSMVSTKVTTSTNTIHSSTGITAGIVVGILAGLILVAIISWRIYKWVVNRPRTAKL